MIVYYNGVAVVCVAPDLRQCDIPWLLVVVNGAPATIEVALLTIAAHREVN
jgi:hypothetical protein